jgi:hypothetical protein
VSAAPTGRKAAQWTAIDRDYETLRIGMQALFADLGITRAIAKSCGLTSPLEGATPSWCWSLVGGLEEALTVGADHLLEFVKGAFDGVDIKAHLGPLDG